MDALLAWYDNKPNRGLPLLLGIALTPLILVVVAGLFLPEVAPFVGALAGACLFAAFYLGWHRLLSADLQDATDFKHNYELGHRRIGGAVAAVVWIVIVSAAGRHLPGPAVGTATVLFALTLFWIVRATPEEADEQLAKYEEAQAHKEAEAVAAAQAAEYADVYGAAYDDLNDDGFGDDYLTEDDN